MFTYIPKKSKEIYNLKIAHRGYHKYLAENTIEAYLEAIARGYAIELDIRYTKDRKIICIHDRYAKRLLGKYKKIISMKYNEIKRLCIKGTYLKVPLFKDVLKILPHNSCILVEVKGFGSSSYIENLRTLIEEYKEKFWFYFHVKNLFTYFKLKKLYHDRVFWILNPFRKRFDFIKTKDYEKYLD